MTATAEPTNGRWPRAAALGEAVRNAAYPSRAPGTGDIALGCGSRDTLISACLRRANAVEQSGWRDGRAHRTNAVSTTRAASRTLSPRYRPGIRWRVEAEMNALPA